MKSSDEYSILKPLTSSDSPSTKSKGARFVSANIEITQTIKKKLQTKEIKVKNRLM